eukprot:7019218-Pyramimonas_sp.AAC.1
MAMLLLGISLGPTTQGQLPAPYWTLGSFPEEFRSADEGCDLLQKVSSGYAGFQKQLLHSTCTEAP